MLCRDQNDSGYAVYAESTDEADTWSAPGFTSWPNARTPLAAIQPGSDVLIYQTTDTPPVRPTLEKRTSSDGIVAGTAVVVDNTGDANQYPAASVDDVMLVWDHYPAGSSYSNGPDNSLMVIVDKTWYASLSGVGTLTAVGWSVHFGAASLAGVGTLTAIGPSVHGVYANEV